MRVRISGLQGAVVQIGACVVVCHTGGEYMVVAAVGLVDPNPAVGHDVAQVDVGRVEDPGVEAVHIQVVIAVVVGVSGTQQVIAATGVEIPHFHQNGMGGEEPATGLGAAETAGNMDGDAAAVGVRVPLLGAVLILDIDRRRRGQDVVGFGSAFVTRQSHEVGYGFGGPAFGHVAHVALAQVDVEENGAPLEVHAELQGRFRGGAVDGELDHHHIALLHGAGGGPGGQAGGPVIA
ncbi:hypothetical protein CSA17_05275, partial [bacterium DOLJORAL78_65_58]